MRLFMQGKKISCPTCRGRTKVTDVAYVDNGRQTAGTVESSDAVEEANIEVKGSYGTKVSIQHPINSLCTNRSPKTEFCKLPIVAGCFAKPYWNRFRDACAYIEVTGSYGTKVIAQDPFNSLSKSCPSNSDIAICQQWQDSSAKTCNRLIIDAYAYIASQNDLFLLDKGPPKNRLSITLLTRLSHCSSAYKSNSLEIGKQHCGL